MKASIKNIVLPDAPAPTRAAYKKPVVGTYAPGMRVIEIPSVYHPKPAPIPKTRPKRKAKTQETKRQKWTDDKVQQVIYLYQKGATLEVIAGRMKCSQAMASMVISKARSDGKIKGYRSRVDWTDEQEQEMIRLYKAGKSFKAIAKAIGRSTSNTHTKIQRLIDSGELEDRKDRRDT